MSHKMTQTGQSELTQPPTPTSKEEEEERVKKLKIPRWNIKKKRPRYTYVGALLQPLIELIYPVIWLTHVWCVPPATTKAHCHK